MVLWLTKDSEEKDAITSADYSLFKHIAYGHDHVQVELLYIYIHI